MNTEKKNTIEKEIDVNKENQKNGLNCDTNKPEDELNSKLINSINEAHLPHYMEIPDIGLYLNQVAKYINEYLKPLGDLSITESMISNYVKQHIIKGPERKLYFRDQIAYLFFITIAKSILSLDNIKYLIEKQQAEYTLKEAYNSFADKFLYSLGYVFGIEKETPASTEDLLDKIIVNITHKIYIDQYFASIKEKEEK